jgi:hypothetical protein
MNATLTAKFKSVLGILVVAVFVFAALALGFVVVKNTASYVNPADPPTNIPINDCQCPGSH